MQTFETKLRNAADRAGIDISALRVIPVTVDNNWGDLVGYAFVGPDGLVERAVRYSLWFHSHSRMPGTYRAQNANMDRGIRRVYVDVKTLHSLGIETKYQQGQDALTARVASTTYYAGD